MARREVRYAGRLYFRRRSCEVEFLDFPGFRARALMGREFQARIEATLAAHIAARWAKGQAIPNPTTPPRQTGGGEPPVRWFCVEIPEDRGGADRTLA